MGVVKEIIIDTAEKEQIIDITDRIKEMIISAGLRDALVCLYVPHSSAAITIHHEMNSQERPRLDEMLDKINPEEDSAHYTKAALVAPTEVLIVKDGQLIMDGDQRIYFYEFDGPKRRRVMVYMSE